MCEFGQFQWLQVPDLSRFQPIPSTDEDSRSRLKRLKLVGLVAYFQRHQYHPWAIPESPWVSRRKSSFMTGMIWGYAHFWKPPPK